MAAAFSISISTPCPFTKFLITCVETEIYRYCSKSPNYTNTNAHCNSKSWTSISLFEFFVSIEIQMHSEGSRWLLFVQPGQLILWLSTRSTFDLQVLFSPLPLALCLSRFRPKSAPHAPCSSADSFGSLATAPAPTPQGFTVFVQLTVSAISYGLYLWSLFAIGLFN